jgi:hypothetical protein
LNTLTGSDETPESIANKLRFLKKNKKKLNERIALVQN